MKVNLLQGTCTPTLTPMPGVHHTLHRIAARLRFCLKPKHTVGQLAVTGAVSLS
jgi:hypothetical protein